MQNHTTPAKFHGKMPQFWVLLFIGIIWFSSPYPSWSKDVPGGELNENTTWKLIESPYVVSGPVQIGGGATLTIEAGVVVKFTGNSAGIEVLDGGRLAAEGAAAEPVIFTEIRDDTAGGDTNGDSASPAAGSWSGIEVKGGGNAMLLFAQVRYAKTAIFKTGAGSLTMEECTVSNSSGEGLSFDSTSDDHLIMNCQFKNNDVGIFIIDTLGDTTIMGCHLSGNSYGITLFGVLGPSEGSIFVGKSTIIGNDVGIFYSDGPRVVIGGSDSSRNNILKNTTYGVENESPDVLVNATHNWWGDYSGPTHASNPAGKGDTVSDYVNFSDFVRISALAGDLNNDNGVGLDDVVIGLQVMTGITPAGFHPEYAIAGIDVNGDGRAGLAEAIYTLREVAGVNE